MKTNLKVILAAMSAAALLVSSASAKTVHHPEAATTATNALGDVHASAVPYSPYGVANEGGPYMPSKPVPGFGKNNDFQDGPR
jgi:hypothetical protein